MKKNLPNKNRIRHLNQYKNLTNEEFDKVWQDEFVEPRKLANTDDMELRVSMKLGDFENDYDLTDLKINDKIVLRQLVQAMIQLEDLETEAYKLREGGVGESDWMEDYKNLNAIMTALRKDISQMQADLNITRKIRKGDKETSVLSFLDDLKIKAKKFYESKMAYIFCPKCNMLLATIWVQYPELSGNKLQLVCGRHLENGEICGEKFTVSLKDLIEEKRGVNSETVPEYFK